MRSFHSSVTDLRQVFIDTVETFPYECGWADEAIFFVTAEEGTAPGTRVSLRVQLSADGIRWLDEGSTLTLNGPESGFVRVTHFAGFLRLAGTIADGVPPTTDGVTLTVRLALKG